MAEQKERDVFQLLSEPFDESRLKPINMSDGSVLTYIPAFDVIKRLNDVLGMKWDFRIISSEILERKGLAVVTGALVIRDDDGNESTRQQCGASRLYFDRGSITNGDEAVKSASTRALKKCAQAFGVGLYLCEREEEMELMNVGGHAVADDDGPCTEVQIESVTRLIGDSGLSVDDFMAKINKTGFEEVTYREAADILIGRHPIWSEIGASG